MQTDETFRVCTQDIELHGITTRGINQLRAFLTQMQMVRRKAHHTIFSANFHAESRFERPFAERGFLKRITYDHRYFQEMQNREFDVLSFDSLPISSQTESHVFYKSIDRQTAVAVKNVSILDHRQKGQLISKEGALCVTFYPMNSMSLESFAREVFTCFLRGGFPVVLSDNSVDMNLFRLIDQTMQECKDFEPTVFSQEFTRRFLGKINFTRYWCLKERIISAIQDAVVRAQRNYSLSVRLSPILVAKEEDPPLFLRKKVWIAAAAIIAFLTSYSLTRLNMNQQYIAF